MSKYEPLARFLAGGSSAIALTFEEIERILGFRLPPSARKYPAWWSNHESSHVQTRAWLTAGFQTGQVDIGGEKVVFSPAAGGFGEEKQARFAGAASAGIAVDAMDGTKVVVRHPAWGALKGMITIPEGVDLTEPAFSDWKSLYGE
jgi:hypothetical protein